MRDVRGIYNAVVVLADAGRLDLAQEVFDLADEQRVPVEIKGGTHLARLAAEDAIEQAIAKARGEVMIRSCFELEMGLDVPIDFDPYSDDAVEM